MNKILKYKNYRKIQKFQINKLLKLKVNFIVSKKWLHFYSNKIKSLKKFQKII